MISRDPSAFEVSRPSELIAFDTSWTHHEDLGTGPVNQAGRPMIALLVYPALEVQLVCSCSANKVRILTIFH